MSIISKESWDKLSEGEKEKTRKYYSEFVNLAENGIDEEERIVNYHLKVAFEVWLGKENLQPEPKIKVWEDVEKKGLVHADTGSTYLLDIDKKHYTKELALKALATLQIAKLIELGYGGMVTKDEWGDNNCRKYTIDYYPQDKRRFVAADYCIGEYKFIAFHTTEQRDEFMSHESNRRLVQQYYI